MAQFAAYRLPGGELVIDLQSDLTPTPTRVVAPLVEIAADAPALSRLEPVFDIEGRSYAMRTSEMISVRRRYLAGPAVADLSSHDWSIRRALDLLFSGI